MLDIYASRDPGSMSGNWPDGQKIASLILIYGLTFIEEV